MSARQTWQNLSRRIIEPEPSTGCWVWLGRIDSDGYGIADYAGRAWRAHRLIYTLVVGPVSPEMVMDHLCRTRCCVRPEHLEPVTTKENNLRGWTWAQWKARQTHCVRGHPLSGSNLAIRAGRSRLERRCRACDAIRSAEYLRRKNGAAS